MLSKFLATVPGFKRASNGRFFYPRDGFGQITKSLYHEAKKGGAGFYLNTQVTSLQRNGDEIRSVCCYQNGKLTEHFADYIWSTIPLTKLVRSIQPEPPSSVLLASNNIQFRAMILVYLVLEQTRYSEYDAHYFPSSDIPISRLSEPKNYSNAPTPKDLTVLCAELPCSSEDAAWGMTDHELGRLVANCLESAGLSIEVPIRDIITQRLHHAYPVYQRGYELYLNRVEQWLLQMENLVTFGRQGLFVHDNTHHALFMAYAAVQCLNANGNFDRSRWKEFRQVFDTHVVED
jgi:protoporphyrinogen oxidase